MRSLFKASVSSKREEGDEDGAGTSRFVLRDLDFTVRRGSLVGVVGRVGSGKSLLLRSILGEMRREGGSMAAKDPLGGVAYVQQEPWLRQGSLRENVLFETAYDEDRCNLDII